MYEYNLLLVSVSVFCENGVGGASGNSFLLQENIFNSNEKISYNFMVLCLLLDAGWGEISISHHSIKKIWRSINQNTQTAVCAFLPVQIWL